jgi:hypothetical protein
MIMLLSMYCAVLSGLTIWIAYHPQIKSALLAAQNAMFR